MGKGGLSRPSLRGARLAVLSLAMLVGAGALVLAKTCGAPKPDDDEDDVLPVADGYEAGTVMVGKAIVTIGFEDRPSRGIPRTGSRMRASWCRHRCASTAASFRVTG